MVDYVMSANAYRQIVELVNFVTLPMLMLLRLMHRSCFCYLPILYLQKSALIKVR